MRIRNIKPEFWRSEDVTRLPRELRLLYVGLWSYADDNGVGIDDYRSVAADLFALEEDQNEVREFVREGLTRLSEESRLVRYQLGSRNLIYVNNWDSHQKVYNANKPRFPRPVHPEAVVTCGNVESPETLGIYSGVSTEGLGTGIEVHRYTGTGVKTSSSLAVDGFEEFYAEYPRRVARKDAEKAWAKAIEAGADAAVLIAAARQYAEERQGQELKFTKHPATWLNQGCWMDERSPNGEKGGEWRRFSEQ